jgi:hypothetical protein
VSPTCDNNLRSTGKTKQDATRRQEIFLRHDYYSVYCSRFKTTDIPHVMSLLLVT